MVKVWDGVLFGGVEPKAYRSAGAGKLWGLWMSCENADQAFMIPEVLIKGWLDCIQWSVINNSMNITAAFDTKLVFMPVA